MQIYCINNFANTNNQKKYISKSHTSFCAHPNYTKFMDKFETRFQASCYFRRDGELNGFSDISLMLKELYSRVKKPKTLIVGVANAQEPFSYLAEIKHLNQNEKLKNIIDLHCVDLKPKISEQDLERNSYFDGYELIFGKTSFETKNEYSRPKIKSEIFTYLKKVFNNPKKTKWDTPIEEFSASTKDKDFDLISINNVLCYILDDRKKVKTMENLCKMIKKDGYLITDRFDQIYKEDYPCLVGFKNINPGIWQKL